MPARIRHCVYVFHDVAGVVLYVGRSMRPFDRLAQHRADKDWWREVATIRLIHVEDAAAAAACEREVIARLAPRFNVALNEAQAAPLHGWTATAWAETNGEWLIEFTHPAVKTRNEVRGYRDQVHRRAAEEFALRDFLVELEVAQRAADTEGASA